LSSENWKTQAGPKKTTKIWKKNGAKSGESKTEIEDGQETQQRQAEIIK